MSTSKQPTIKTITTHDLIQVLIGAAMISAVRGDGTNTPYMNKLIKELKRRTK